MRLLTTYKITSRVSTTEVGEWITENNMFERVSFDWVKKHLMFEDTEDATAFSLRFGLRPVETTLDRMIRDATH